MSFFDYFDRLGGSFFTYRATKCGHFTKRRGKISVFGHTVTMLMPKNQEGLVDYCLECIGDMTIRCAWCGEPIFIGQPVTLYTPADSFKVPHYAVVYKKDPLQLIGCLSWDCASTLADRAGFWVLGEDGKGKVFPVPTIYERILAGEGNSAVIVQNSGDIEEALNHNSSSTNDK